MYTNENISEIYNTDELPEGTLYLYFKLIDGYQREDPFLSGKVQCTKYEEGYFHGGRNTIRIVTYNDKIVIPQKLQQYLVKLYHAYILHTRLDQTKAMISQRLYLPRLIKSVHMEVTRCEKC